MIGGRPWTFNVSCATKDGEVVCIVGSCEELGCWDPCRVVPMQALLPDNHEDHSMDGGYTGWYSGRDLGEDGEDYGPRPTVWTITLQLPENQTVGYRYCVGVAAVSPDQSAPVYAIQRWETHFNPRTLPTTLTQDPESTGDVSLFGVVCGQKRVESGWLVYDTAVHLKLCISRNYPDPIVLWKSKYQHKKVRVKVTQVELGAGNSQLEDSTETADVRAASRNQTWPILELAVLKEGECRFKQQQQFGLLHKKEDFTLFQCRMLDYTTIAYLFDFYIDDPSEDIPRFIGCSFVLPTSFKDNFGILTVPITSPRHMPIGQLTVHYMVVKPMPACVCDMSVSYARYWKEEWTCLEVGHRGSGNSYHSQPKSCSTIRENTIASLKSAAESGADMVELDVQLSRDLVPVIYHDFHACIALKRKKDQDHSDLLEVPIKDLTLQQLQALKVYHKKEKGLNQFGDEEFEDHQPFPTLEQALTSVPHTCGFNIEVKWTMQLKDGTYELLHPFELNGFLDIILKVVLEHGGRRKIVLSCFHPDICSILRLKQNRYPVLFLTQGQTKNLPPYEDVRCQSIHEAVLYAKTADILGINLLTEDLLRDPTQMATALENDLVVFCWGDQNNDESTIAVLKKLGVHAIIYDKIDVYKQHKENIFLSEERQLQKRQQSNSFSSSGSDEDEASKPTCPKVAKIIPTSMSEIKVTTSEMQITPSVAAAPAPQVDRTNLSAMLAAAKQQTA